MVEIDYLLLIKKPHLPRRHARILVQIRPGRVDDGDVVFLIACAEPINQSINQISHHQSLSSISCIIGMWAGPGAMDWRTFNRIRLGQLRALLHQLLGQRVPCLLGREAQVDVRGGEVVGVELSCRFLNTVRFSFPPSKRPLSFLPVGRTDPGEGRGWLVVRGGGGGGGALVETYPMFKPVSMDREGMGPGACLWSPDIAIPAEFDQFFVLTGQFGRLDIGKRTGPPGREGGGGRGGGNGGENRLSNLSLPT